MLAPRPSRSARCFSHSPPGAPVRSARVFATLLALAVISACSPDRVTTALNPSGAASRGVPFTEGLASPEWQAIARQLVGAANMSPVQGAHTYPVLSVAQYIAVQRAEAELGGGDSNSPDDFNGGGRPRIEADRGAVAGASAVTLSYLFPASASTFESMVVAQENAGPGNSGPMREAFEAGEEIGRAVGAQIVARTIADHFDAPNTAVPPVGPGFWTSSAIPPTPVDGGQLQGVRPWFLTSASQFRPPPPPTFGGAEFNAGLAEIRHISDTRTAEQIQIATFWALPKGTPTTAGFWLSVPTDSGWVSDHALSERETTHMYALASATIFDAQIGCWDEKLTSWLIRPWKADPGITVVPVVGKPNHPSYPSGHSCLSSSAAEVLKMFFPEKSAQLDAMVIQAGLSRMYGGIHYSFDIAAGQTLGRNVARFTIAADASGNSVLTPH